MGDLNFDGIDEKQAAAAVDEQAIEASHCLQTFSANAEAPEVVLLCDEITKTVSELAEGLELDLSPTTLAMLAGLALSRAQVVQARTEAGDPVPEG